MFIDLLILDLAELIANNDIPIIKAVLPRYGKLLLMRDSRTKETVVHVAAACNSVNVLELLRNNKADMSSVDALSNNLLHTAAYHHSNDVLSWLLQWDKASLNNRNSCGETPLFVAARKGSKDCLRTLLEIGCRIDIKDSKGVSPLEISRIKREKALFDREKRRKFQKIFDELQDFAPKKIEEKIGIE